MSYFTKTQANESAFPEVNEIPQFGYHTYGLTKREYFAVMAMQGFIANPNNKNWVDFHPRNAVEIADQLIKELNKLSDAYSYYRKCTSANSSEWNKWMRDNGDNTLSMFTEEEFEQKIKEDKEFANYWMGGNK